MDKLLLFFYVALCGIGLFAIIFYVAYCNVVDDVDKTSYFSWIKSLFHHER